MSQKLAEMELFFKACADQTRLRILHLLSEEAEICVCDLVEVLGTNQPKVSRHLAYLKNAGLIQMRKEGLWMYYHLASAMDRPQKQVLMSFLACCPEVPILQTDLQKLKTVLKEMPIPKKGIAVKSKKPSRVAIASEPVMAIELL